MNRLTELKWAILPLLIMLLLACFASRAQAVVPPPDGCYPGFTTAEGCNALKNLTTGVGDTGIGWYSLFSADAANYNTGVGAGTLALNTADSNTAVGTAAMILNISGHDNVAVGTAALLNNQSGNFNTASGVNALTSNTEGSFNVGNGINALFSNTVGIENTASGFEALFSNIDGDKNTANGAQTLLTNTSGTNNTAVGYQALLSNTIGDANTAVGVGALQSNTEAAQNTALGSNALSNNTVGSQNTAIGSNALFNGEDGSFNTAVGSSAMPSLAGGSSNTAVGNSALLQVTTGAQNTAVGVNAGSSVTTADHVIAIGNPGANVSNSCFIGQIYSNVQPIVGTDPDSVTITSAGRLGRGNVSSRRYKHDIRLMDKSSEAIYALRPVSFRYNKEYDATQTLAFGLIAEEVAEVYPDLVGRNPEGQPESVRYEQINAMLLNEFLKEHAKVAEQQNEIDSLKEELKEQKALIQKVSDKMQLNEPALHTVVSKQ